MFYRCAEDKTLPLYNMVSICSAILTSMSPLAINLADTLTCGGHMP
jgi:hypothetical protein